MKPLFGIPLPGLTTIKNPALCLKKADFDSPSKNKTLKCPITHDLILTRGIPLVPVRNTMRRSVRNLSRLLTHFKI